jgi:hypothetical protein
MVGNSYLLAANGAQSLLVYKCKERKLGDMGESLEITSR